MIADYYNSLYPLQISPLNEWLIRSSKHKKCVILHGKTTERVLLDIDEKS